MRKTSAAVVSAFHRTKLQLQTSSSAKRKLHFDSQNVQSSSVVPMFKEYSQNVNSSLGMEFSFKDIPYTDLSGKEQAVPRFTNVAEAVNLRSTERACTDDFTTGNSRRFCRLFKISERTRSVLIPRQLHIKDDSPSQPFRDTPSLGVDLVLRSVFRARGRGVSSSMGTNYFSCWVAAPSFRGLKALAFTAGHSFAGSLEIPYNENGPFDFGEFTYSEVVGCFGSEVQASEFDTLGFNCSTQPSVIVNSKEDMTLFEVSEHTQDILLPCSAIEECIEDKFLAAFSYPCTHTFLVQAQEELLDGKKDYGIREMYSDLGVDNVVLYELLYEVYHPFPDGTLVCSPGHLTAINEAKCCYKCSTLGGSSGGPIILSHLPNYVVGIHDGGFINRNLNFATSTDSPSFVACYSKFVLPRLPPRGDTFWNGWNLQPFERWLAKHGLIWE